MSNHIVFAFQWSILTKWLTTKVSDRIFVLFSLIMNAKYYRRDVIPSPPFPTLHLASTPEEANAGVIINLVNEVLLG